jgi:aromatic ring-opening dioxygenase LigB subunit
MEYLKMCCIVPHPPILIPEIGGTEVKKLKKSTEAMKELAGQIRQFDPETLVVISPHSPVHREAFIMQEDKQLSGSFSMFRAPQVTLQSTTDANLAEALFEAAGSKGIPVARGPGSRDAGGGGGNLDHGILVPLYFLAPQSFSLLCISISLLSYWDHYRLGTAIREAVESTGHRTVFIGSGDMSHRLIRGAPAGYSPRGEEFDLSVVRIMESGDYEKLFGLDEGLIDEAGECGLRSIFAVAGAVDGYAVESRVLSYEGPFGVGYMVASVIPGEQDPGRELPPPGKEG